MGTIKRYEIRKAATEFVKEKITSGEDAAHYIRQFYGDDLEIYESFFMLMLNHQLQTVGYAKISQGGIVGTTVDKRIVLKYVVDCLATHVILAHNHPSGTLHPSEADKIITKEIKELCAIMNTNVVDHIILTAEGFYSFAQNDLL